MPVVLQFDRPGPPSVLQFRDIPAPEPGPGEVRYKVLAFGLNRADLMYMADVYYSSPAYPARLGHDAAGIVDAVGPGVTAFKAGDYVSSIAQENGRYGVNGEFAITPALYLAPWAKGFNALEACSVWSSNLTAYYSLVELAKISAGQAVLITAASSTAGTGAIQTAKLLGAKVIATSRNREKEAFLRSIGADEVIATDDNDNIGSEIMRMTDGVGVKAVFDMIGGRLIERYIECIANEASVHLVGNLEGDLRVSFLLPQLIRTGSTITGFSIFNLSRDRNRLERAKAFISASLDNQKVRPIIDRIYEFPETIEAYGHMQSGNQRGKIVIKVDPQADHRIG